MKLRSLLALIFFFGLTLWLLHIVDLIPRLTRDHRDSRSDFPDRTTFLSSAVNNLDPELLNLVNEGKSVDSIIEYVKKHRNPKRAVFDVRKNANDVSKPSSMSNTVEEIDVDNKNIDTIGTNDQRSNSDTSAPVDLLEYPGQELEVVKKFESGGFIVHEKSVMAKVGVGVNKGVAGTGRNVTNDSHKTAVPKRRVQSASAHVFWSDNYRVNNKNRVNVRLLREKTDDAWEKADDTLDKASSDQEEQIARVREDVVIQTIQNGKILGTVRRSDQFTNKTLGEVENFTLNVVSKNSKLSSKTSLSLCPLVPPNLIGNFTPKIQDFKLGAISVQNPSLRFGGHYYPPNCKSRNRVAIIIPLRNNSDWHLKILLYNLHPMLIRQQIEYR